MAQKIQSIPHTSVVNCVAIGRRSGRLLVAGCEDKTVHVWSVGAPKALASLNNTAPVMAVQFDGAEEVVLAGGTNGVLKMWDLEQSSSVRTLSGHRADILCAEFHPYGEFIASGSVDTNVKIWDVRRRTCIQTYRGQGGPVNCVRFSPDGNWLVSGSDDAAVRLWDLRAAKLLTEFKLHQGPVTSIEFHPNEFLLASGGGDRTVKFWDLEQFSLASSSIAESSQIRCLSFHPEGSVLYSGGQDTLRSYSWEPTTCLESVLANWGRVTDMHTPEPNLLVSASVSQSNVNVWMVDLKENGLANITGASATVATCGASSLPSASSSSSLLPPTGRAGSSSLAHPSVAVPVTLAGVPVATRSSASSLHTAPGHGNENNNTRPYSSSDSGNSNGGVSTSAATSVSIAGYASPSRSHHTHTQWASSPSTFPHSTARTAVSDGCGSGGTAGNPSPAIISSAAATAAAVSAPSESSARLPPAVATFTKGGSSSALSTASAAASSVTNGIHLPSLAALNLGNSSQPAPVSSSSARVKPPFATDSSASYEDVFARKPRIGTDPAGSCAASTTRSSASSFDNAALSSQTPTYTYSAPASKAYTATSAAASSRPATTVSAPAPAPASATSANIAPTAPVYAPTVSAPLPAAALAAAASAAADSATGLRTSNVVAPSRNKPLDLDPESFLHGASKVAESLVTEENVLLAVEQGHEPMATVMSTRLKHLKIVRGYWL